MDFEERLRKTHLCQNECILGLLERLEEAELEKKPITLEDVEVLNEDLSVKGTIRVPLMSIFEHERQVYERVAEKLYYLDLLDKEG